MKRLARIWGSAAGFIFGALLCLFETAAAVSAADPYMIRHTEWSEADEQGFSRFIAALGESDCASLDECLHSEANPFRDSDPATMHFESDCADLPYVLRFYYAYKRGLPFSYVDKVETRGGEDDIRYSKNGNRPLSRHDILGGNPAFKSITALRDGVSSASYRIDPDLDGPVAPDFYSPAIKPGSIHPGTIVYDPAGHVAIVYRIDPNGQIHSFDAHTDYSLTTITFDVRFARSRPAQGSGFKNWRPLKLEGAKKMPDGSYRGGHVVAAMNRDIADFSTEQFYGTGKRTDDWASGGFDVNGQAMGYYDFVRARLAGGKLVFDPVKEIEEMTSSLCSDLRYRAAAVTLARPLTLQAHPERLPKNIYGTEGDWETYSTPSRDARLKVAFKHLRDMAERFVELKAMDEDSLFPEKSEISEDLLNAYRKVSQSCALSYRKSDGTLMNLSFDEARRRLFALSFDPYHCPERRWGASDPEELKSCPADAVKEDWYEAEQALRNQLERTYEARMDVSLIELKRDGLGARAAPDTDVEGYLTKRLKLASPPIP